MNEAMQTGASTLTTAIRTLEQLLRNHIVSMETAEKQFRQMKAATGSVKTKATRKLSRQKLNSGIDEEAAADGGAKKRLDKVTVTVRVIFMKIGTIDTIHDRYSADVMVLSRWREPALDHQKQEAVSQIDWDSYWDPKISIANGIGDMKYTVSYSLHRDEVGGAMVVEHRHCQGQFFEFMELNKFPFDSQDLTVNITTDRTEEELGFMADEADPSGVNTGAFSAEQEWRLDDRVNVWKKLMTKKTAKGKTRVPNIYVAAKASRRPQFFIYNIIIIMFSISSMAFATFTVKLETPESRLPLTYILVLTTVTFKFVVNKSLPKISYLTYLDKYILGSMMILCCVCVWHALAGSVICNSTAAITAATTTTTPAATTITTSTTSTPGGSTYSFIYTNSTITTKSSSSISAICPKKEKCVASSTAIVIDYIALGCLASVYIGFHIVFLVLINCSGGDEGPNEEIDLGDEEEDGDDAWKEGKEGDEGNHHHHHQQQHHANGIKEKVLIALEGKSIDGHSGISVFPSANQPPHNKDKDATVAVVVNSTDKDRSLPSVE